jgi:hypothetical protein
MIFAAGYTSAQEKWVQDRVMQKRSAGPAPTVPVIRTNYIESTITRYFFSPFGINAIGPSFRVLPNSNQQDEVILTSNRQQPLLLFGSANTSVGSTYGQGMYISTNGGLNWYGNDILPNLPGSTSDPAPIIDKDGRFIFTTLNTSSSAATMVANYSTNNGTTWSAYTTITSASSDKNFAASDDAPSSPYYGRTYAVWSNMALSNPPIVVSYTTNGGVSWSTPTQINTPPSGHYSQGCDIAIGPAGQVYVIWAAPVSASPYTEDFAGFAKSTNGGVSWTVTENAFDMNGIRSSSYNGWGVRTNSFPRIAVDRSGGPTNGYIYIVESDVNLAPAGSDADVVLHRSTDGGTTWSSGIRVNQDAMNNGKVQFFPAICVDAMGGVNVVYYDNRNFPSVGDSAGVFMSRSINGGITWTDVQVSDHNWKVKSEPNFAPYMGDYIGITSTNGKVFPFWFDDKSGSMQAWTCIIDLGPSISHTPLTNTELISGNRAVNCTITPAGSGINPSTVKLYYAKNSTTFTAVTMTNSSGTNWTANLPLSGAGTYNYYLTATDSLSRTATSPSGAPGSYYSFIAATDTVKPVITHTQLGNTPKTQWPATITATVTDNIGVDSVWVRWKKSGSATVKQFRLLNTTGSTYSAAFNSVQADVNVGDTISYRVIARDISSMHNADSTAQYSFNIINQVTVTVGTGTTSSNFPFTTYWDDGRTNYLYFASELGTGSALITSIGFNVISANAQAMNEFTIKMQNTNATSISGFTADGWTNCLTTTYTVPGSGWQMIDLATPFAYTGGNLLVEVCYNNSTYGNYSTVYASATTGDFYGRYNDLPTASGCGYTAWTSTTNPPGKANTRFVMNPGPTGVTPIGTTVPQTYSLSQNYPNPFNPVTKINFAIPKQGFTTLKIYDMLGREVSKLVNEVKTAGTYSVDFDASKLSSGVYFYKLDVNGFADVKRMVLVK